jgi:hypothetical protein
MGLERRRNADVGPGGILGKKVMDARFEEAILLQTFRIGFLIGTYMDGKEGRELADFCQIDGLELLEIQGGMGHWPPIPSWMRTPLFPV